MKYKIAQKYIICKLTFQRNRDNKKFATRRELTNYLQDQDLPTDDIEIKRSHYHFTSKY